MSRTMFTASSIWRGPDDAEKVVYFSGITQETFDNLKLVNSFDVDYPDNTAFKIAGTENHDLSRIYKPLSTDTIVITNVSSTVTYGVDDNKNLIIFPTNSPLSEVDIANIKVKLVRNYASIHKSNLTSFQKVLDFSSIGERAITSMIASNDGIFLGGVSGNIWFYDGDVIKGPVYTLAVSDLKLPVTSLILHRFAHETEDFIYASGDKRPRLFRSKLSTALNGDNWEEVYAQGELASSTGGILSMTSAFNQIFLGCRNNKVLKYSRDNEIVLSDPIDLVSKEPVQENVAIETLDTVTFVSNNIDDFEPINFSINCMESARNQVFAGLSNKPEIWSYTELTVSNPENPEEFANTIFDEVFKNDPSPGQYYSYDNKTISRTDENLGISYFPDSVSMSGYSESLVIRGNTRTSIGATAYGTRFFEFDSGSDWEQAQSNILPDQDFYMIDCATTKELTSLENIYKIDGHDVLEYQLVMVKDQPSTSLISNGIYRLEANTLVPYYDLTIVNDSQVIGFYIVNGYVNSTSRYMLSVDEYNADNYNFYKPKYTLEFVAKNLAYTQGLGCTTLDYCVSLNTDEVVGTATTYTGYQGIEVADVYGIYSLQFNNNSLLLKSGSKTVTKTLPSYGNYKNWLFSSSTGATTQGWTTGEFVSSMIGSTESSSDGLSNPYTKYLLRVEPATFGNTKIEALNINTEVDQKAVIKVRLKIPPADSYGFEDAHLKAYWTYEGGSFSNYASEPIVTSDGYVDYVIKPTWKGTIGSLMLEFDNIPEGSRRPLYYYIDYIKIINEDIIFDLNNVMSAIRVTVEGKDIKVWLGKQEYPYVYEKNFIEVDNYNSKYIRSTLYSNDYDKPYLRIGKIENKAGDSLFAYNRLSFKFGESLKPTKKKVFDFHESFMMNGAGGVRLFTYHDGTIYGIADGFESNKVSENPDDRQAQVFRYEIKSGTWIKDVASFERRKVFNPDGSYQLRGLIRPLTSVSYKGNLYLSGQYGNIKVV